MTRRSVPKPSRKPPLLPSLLKALDARPDVTVLTRTWPVLFVQLRYVLEKTVVNPDGFSPLHRETPLFYGQAWKAVARRPRWYDVETMPPQALDGRCDSAEAECNDAAFLDLVLGPIPPEVAARLGLAPAAEREPAIVGRALER